MSVLIIAEAGVNHNGEFEIAKRMVDAAKNAGADYVKFQTFQVDKLVSNHAKAAEYQKKNIGKDSSQKEMLEKLALSQKEFVKLRDYCKEVGIGFLSTPFDLESISFLDKLDMDFWKIPSGEITNLPYLMAIAKTKRPVILSTGMCTLHEVEAAVNVLKENKITLLHCNTEYPTPFEDVNLKAMDTLKDKFQCPVGYSDHTLGIHVPIAAVARGAQVIEKHFTLDRKMEGPDHVASLEPEELRNMIISIHQIEQSLGTGEKVPSSSEQKNITVARKSIVAAQRIQKGESFTEDNLTVKRPGNGISPMHWFECIGKCASRTYEIDDMIEEVL